MLAVSIARLEDSLRRQRTERGQPPVPPVAVVTRSGNLNWSSPFFTMAEQRPIVFATANCEPGARQRAEKVADFVLAGEDSVDVRNVTKDLHRRGYRSVLLEGGPTLNADFVEAGLLDELCLTLSPHLVGGSGPRVLAGGQLEEPLGLEVVHLLEDDGFLFYRLAVNRRNEADKADGTSRS